MITDLAKKAATCSFRVGFENADFERGMIKLTAVTGGTVDNVTAAFKEWAQTTPFPWQVVLDYCVTRAIEGKSLPFTING